MGKFENISEPQISEVKKPDKVTRAEVISMLESGENLENLILADLDLAGLDLEGKSFRGSDIRGASLYRKDQGEDGKSVEVKTNIKGADITDATIADLGPEVFFGRVDAEGAMFGYSEDLISRRKRHKESGEAPKAADTGGLFGFNGSQGNFRKTKWVNADFGGGSGYESVFPGADLSEAVIEGSDISGMDFSETKIDNIVIKDPVGLRGMKINEKQIESVARAVQFTNQEKQAEFLKEKEDKDPRKALEDYFQIVIVKTKDKR